MSENQEIAAAHTYAKETAEERLEKQKEREADRLAAQEERLKVPRGTAKRIPPARTGDARTGDMKRFQTNPSDTDPAMEARGFIRATPAPGASPAARPVGDQVGVPIGVGSSHPGSPILDPSDPREFAPATQEFNRGISITPMTPAHNAGDPRSIEEHELVQQAWDEIEAGDKKAAERDKGKE